MSSLPSLPQFSCGGTNLSRGAWTERKQKSIVYCLQDVTHHFHPHIPCFAYGFLSTFLSVAPPVARRPGLTFSMKPFQKTQTPAGFNQGFQGGAPVFWTSVMGSASPLRLGIGFWLSDPPLAMGTKASLESAAWFDTKDSIRNTGIFTKKNEILPFAIVWMDLEGIIPSEFSRSEKDKYHILSFICAI